MSHRPELPVNIIIKWLKDQGSSMVVADFGCGELLYYSFDCTLLHIVTEILLSENDYAIP